MLSDNVGAYVFTWLVGYGSLLGAIGAAMIADYWILRRGRLYLADLSSTGFVPDEIVDRFCVLGAVDDHVANLREPKGMDVDQFDIWLMHDAKEETVDAYGEEIIPALGTKSAV